MPAGRANGRTFTTASPAEVNSSDAGARRSSCGPPSGTLRECAAGAAGLSPECAGVSAAQPCGRGGEPPGSFRAPPSRCRAPGRRAFVSARGVGHGSGHGYVRSRALSPRVPACALTSLLFSGAGPRPRAEPTAARTQPPRPLKRSPSRRALAGVRAGRRAHTQRRCRRRRGTPTFVGSVRRSFAAEGGSRPVVSCVRAEHPGGGPSPRRARSATEAGWVSAQACPPQGCPPAR